MKQIYIISSLAVFTAILLSSTCSNSSSNGGTKQKNTSLDSIWLPFADAMESKNLSFLVKNSLDSVRCCECQIGEDAQKEYFSSEYIFNNHLDKIMHLKSLSNRPFSSYQVDSNTIRIVYSVKSYHAPEETYSLFFTLIKKDDKYLFQGMMVQ